MSQPIKSKLFVWSDLAVIGISLFALVGAIGAQCTKGNPPIGLVIMWVVAAACIAITVIMYVRRKQQLAWLRYSTKGVVVGWKEDKYAVKDTDFEAAVDDFLGKVLKNYPDAQRGLNGCFVFFTDPTFFSWTPGYAVRKVAGIQDDASIVVGWNQNVKQSALEHELGHRVLQVCGGDPPESNAHRILQQMGL